MFPKMVPIEGDAPSPEPMDYPLIYTRSSPQLMSSVTKTEKTYGHRPRSPTWTEGLNTMGCGFVPQRDRYDTAITTTVP